MTLCGFLLNAVNDGVALLAGNYDEVLVFAGIYVFVSNGIFYQFFVLSEHLIAQRALSLGTSARKLFGILFKLFYAGGIENLYSFVVRIRLPFPHAVYIGILFANNHFATMACRADLDDHFFFHAARMRNNAVNEIVTAVAL